MKLPWWLPFGSVREVTPEALALRVDREPKLQILDVRTEGEFARGHIEGAISAPVTELASRLETLQLDPSRPVVAICLSAHRSIPAVRLLEARGFDAAQLAGGMLAWRARHLPEVVSSAKLKTR